jgi:hypothetical protein
MTVVLNLYMAVRSLQEDNVRLRGVSVIIEAVEKL